MTPAPNEAALVERAKAGDRTAFDQLAAHYFTSLAKLVAAQFRAKPEDAEEIAQDALFNAWRYRGSLQAEEKFRWWLRKITMREALRHFAKVSRRPDTVEFSDELAAVIADPAPTPEAHAEARQLADAAAKVIPLLPRKQREAIESTATGSAARNARHLARKRIRRELAGRGLAA